MNTQGISALAVPGTKVPRYAATMSATVQLQMVATVADPAVASSSQQTTVRDLTATTHDLGDPIPMGQVATPGAVGATFVPLPTSVQHAERLIADLGVGADLVLRIGGAPAKVVGSVTANPGLIAGDTLTLNVDGGGLVTTTFAGGESIAQAAAAIDSAFVASGRTSPASVDATSGGLALAGTKTGDASASARGWQSGSLVLGGTALAKLGLGAGTTWGTGDDIRVGGTPVLVLPFPSSSTPARVEVSGSCPNAKFFLAGKAT